MAAIAEAIEATRSGDGRSLLIEGPAGVGKTVLLGELQALAVSAGHRVLRARGSTIEREFAFGVVRQLFGTATRHCQRQGQHRSRPRALLSIVVDLFL